jgi:RND family efflux transporter MFP subunit
VLRERTTFDVAGGCDAAWGGGQYDLGCLGRGLDLEPPRVKTGLSFLPLNFAMAMSLAVAGCGGSRGATPPGGGAPGARSVRVRTAPVVTRDVVYSVQALGALEAEELVQVTAEVDGAVSEVAFHEGDRVTSASVLARIDPDRYRLEAQRAEAGHAKAAADARRAQQELARREELFADKLVAVEELNRARAEADRLAGEAAAAKAAADIARQNVARAEVRPPLPGVIDTRAVSTGQYVKAGALLATLVDTRRLRLRFKVSGAESLRARPGESVQFRVGALGPQEFTARIYHVGEVADPGTRQVEVLAWVKNPGALKPGFFAEVTLATDAHKDALVVPEGAVQASERGFVVYAVESGRAHARPVEVGLRTRTGTVEIVSGLEAGEVVVIEGSDRLADGVEVVDAAAGAGSPGAPSGSAR